MHDFDASSKIDVTSELLKMGINIVAPQLTSKVSLKPLSEANCVNDDDKSHETNEEKASKNRRRRKKKQVTLPSASSPPLPSSSTMFNLTQPPELGLSNAIPSMNPPSGSDRAQRMQQAASHQSERQSKNSKIKVILLIL